MQGASAASPAQHGDYPWEHTAELAASTCHGSQGSVENPPKHLVSTEGHFTAAPKRCCMPMAELSIQGARWAAHPRGCRTSGGIQRTFVFMGFLLFLLKQTPINVNITDVNKHDPKIHVQLYGTGKRGREVRWERGRGNTLINL